MNPEQFRQHLKEKGIHLNDLQMEQFETYFHRLIEYNKRTNLTSIVDKEEVYLKHFYDSLTILTEYESKVHGSLCDVGAGAGFPSVPLKIACPELSVVIVDSLGKRIDFLNLLIEELGLNGIKAIHSRAEDFALTDRERFDYVTARAVARLNVLAELCMPLVKVGGVFIALKGATGDEEHEEAKAAIRLLGGQLKSKHAFTLPKDGGSRFLLAYEKKQATHKKYPRNFSQIKKKPL